VKSPISFAEFDAPFKVFFSDLAERAVAQSEILQTTPGTIVTLVKKGRPYLYWRVYDAVGRRVDRYLGAQDGPDTEAKLSALRESISEAKSLADGSRTLRKHGYCAADNSAAVTLAALFNAGVFGHGAMLVGTHAFGAILNSLGVRIGARYFTEDIDIARYGAIQLAARPDRAFIEILRESGLPFAEVPDLDAARPATSFKVRGQKLRVDLLVPGDARYRAHRVPELKAYATGLPYFGYLLEEPISTIVLGRDQVIPVRVPNPARYCVHKLIVATLRGGAASQKQEKDLLQAAVLTAVLAVSAADSLSSAVDALPRGSKRKAARGAAGAAKLIAGTYPAAGDFLDALAGN
jgi:hypothetical protein